MTRKIALTGAGGILGYHLRVAASASGFETVGIPLGHKFDQSQALEALDGADKILHLAAVNTGDPDEISEGNLRMAKQLVSALDEVSSPPSQLVYSNSIHADFDTAYGHAKRKVGEVLSRASENTGIDYLDIRLPNLFGELARPFRNGVVATFSHLIAHEQEPEIIHDQELQLLRLQNAADVLLGDLSPSQIPALSYRESVSGLRLRIKHLAYEHAQGKLPNVSDGFSRDLFSAYLSQAFPISISDERNLQSPMLTYEGSPTYGAEFSAVIPPGMAGYSHYHRHEIRQVTILFGEAEICIRDALGTHPVYFRISAHKPHRMVVPALYECRVTNIGREDLHSLIWADAVNQNYAVA